MHEPRESPAPLVLFDGVCNLCNTSVAWIIRHDRRARLRFASLQSQAGRAALAAVGGGESLLDSIVLIDRGRVSTRSSAVIGIGRLLGFPWSLAVLALLVPRPLRDALYSWIARNRYRWFGRQNACAVPTVEVRARFMDADEVPTAQQPDATAPCATTSRPRF